MGASDRYVVQTAGGSFLAAETGYGGRATFTTHASEVARFDEATARLKAAAHNGRAVPTSLSADPWDDGEAWDEIDERAGRCRREAS